ncbi:MAG: hypothetical protein KGL39_00400 [Patescibacteria group bacterium]|nr:hypothetical protein [Patescibacteria group bacterium]
MGMDSVGMWIYQEKSRKVYRILYVMGWGRYRAVSAISGDVFWFDHDEVEFCIVQHGYAERETIFASAPMFSIGDKVQFHETFAQPSTVNESARKCLTGRITNLFWGEGTSSTCRGFYCYDVKRHDNGLLCTLPEAELKEYGSAQEEQFRQKLDELDQDLGYGKAILGPVVPAEYEEICKWKLEEYCKLGSEKVKSKPVTLHAVVVDESTILVTEGKSPIKTELPNPFYDHIKE